MRKPVWAGPGPRGRTQGGPSHAPPGRNTDRLSEKRRPNSPILDSPIDEGGGSVANDRAPRRVLGTGQRLLAGPTRGRGEPVARAAGLAAAVAWLMLDAGGCRGGARRPSEVGWRGKTGRPVREARGGGTRGRRRRRAVTPGEETSGRAAGEHGSTASWVQAMGRRSWGQRAGGQVAAGGPAAAACGTHGSGGRNRRRQRAGYAAAAGGGTGRDF